MYYNPVSTFILYTLKYLVQQLYYDTLYKL